MSEQPPQSKLSFLRKIYTPLHFNHWYTFTLFFITAGAMMGFTLSRFMFLSVDNIFCNPSQRGGAAPGECYYYSGQGGQRYRTGIILHLATILPAGFLVCFQFVPVIRHKALLFHRVSGYTILILSVVSTAGVFMIVDKSFGGDWMTQTATGVAGGMFVGALAMAYVNVKMLRLDQHRAWMLRAWSYAASIISLRLIMMIPPTIDSAHGYAARPCDQIDFVFGHRQNITLLVYPECKAYYTGENPDQHALVEAKLGINPVEIGAFLGLSFGMGFCVALPLHALLVEVYLHFTKAEGERLREVSHQRRVDAKAKQGRA